MEEVYQPLFFPVLFHFIHVLQAACGLQAREKCSKILLWLF